jgi:hypothetical protein
VRKEAEYIFHDHVPYDHDDDFEHDEPYDDPLEFVCMLALHLIIQHVEQLLHDRQTLIQEIHTLAQLEIMEETIIHRLEFILLPLHKEKNNRRANDTTRQHRLNMSVRRRGVRLCVCVRVRD